LAQIIELKIGGRSVKILADSNSLVDGWCSILGFWAKRYTLRGKLFKSYFSLPAITIADSFGFDLTTEDGIKSAIHNKDESIKIFKDDQILNYLSSINDQLPECLSNLEPFIGKGLGEIYKNTLYEDETVLAVIECKELDTSGRHSAKPNLSAQLTSGLDAMNRDYLIITDKNIKIVKKDSVPSFMARTHIYHENIPLKAIAKVELDKSKTPNLLDIFPPNNVKRSFDLVHATELAPTIEMLSFLVSMTASMVKEEIAKPVSPANVQAEKLEKAKKLFEDGLIGKEEFEKIKKIA
jgi:hypothetical protein